MVLFMANLFFSVNIDKNPVALKIGGSKIEVYNIAGEKLWDYDFEYPINPQLYQNNLNVEYEDKCHVFIDLNNDGNNELLFLSKYNDSKNSAIIAFDSYGKVLWQYDKHPELVYGDRIYNNTYNIKSLYTHEFNGKYVIFAVFMHYPLVSN